MDFIADLGIGGRLLRKGAPGKPAEKNAAKTERRKVLIV
jgi:hypothetical protein